MKDKELMQQAFEGMTGIVDAWTNPALMQARNGFIQGWEAGVAAEREACVKEISAEINDDLEDEAYCILVALLSRIRARGEE